MAGSKLCQKQSFLFAKNIKMFIFWNTIELWRMECNMYVYLYILSECMG